MKSTKFVIFISLFVSIFSVFAVAFDISPAKNLNGLGKPLYASQNLLFLNIKKNNKEKIKINGRAKNINYEVSPSIDGIDINKISKNIFLVTGKKEGDYYIKFSSDQAIFTDTVLVRVKQ